MKQYLLIITALIASFFINSSSAYADIGGIGSPVVPSNLPPPAKTAPSWMNKGKPVVPGLENKESEEEPTPILVIDFNQRHVYFDRELKQALSSTEASQASATYEVVSHVPADGDGRLKVEHLNEDYSHNLNDVVQAMQDFGIPPSRIHSSTEQSSDITVQQISITIK